jgi:hypothetical protein
MVAGHLDKKERFLRKLTRVTASIDVVDAKNTPSKFLICREIEKTIYTTDVLLLLMLM